MVLCAVGVTEPLVLLHFLAQTLITYENPRHLFKRGFGMIWCLSLLSTLSDLISSHSHQ